MCWPRIVPNNLQWVCITASFIVDVTNPVGDLHLPACLVTQLPNPGQHAQPKLQQLLHPPIPLHAAQACIRQVQRRMPRQRCLRVPRQGCHARCKQCKLAVGACAPKPPPITHKKQPPAQSNIKKTAPNSRMIAAANQKNALHAGALGWRHQRPYPLTHPPANLLLPLVPKHAPPVTPARCQKKYRLYSCRKPCSCQRDRASKEPEYDIHQSRSLALIPNLPLALTLKPCPPCQPGPLSSESSSSPLPLPRFLPLPFPLPPLPGSASK